MENIVAQYNNIYYTLHVLFCPVIRGLGWMLFTFVRHMVNMALFNYVKPVISTGGRIFLIRSGLILLPRLQEKPLSS